MKKYKYLNRVSRENIMQRTFLFFFVFCFYIASAFAQDVITLKNGNDIQALVQEIGEVDVKYKKFDNPNGPNYTLKKSEIFMIRYAIGSKDVFTDNIVTVTTPAPTTEQTSIQNNKGEVYFNFWGTLKYRSTKKKVTNVNDLFYNIPEASKNYHSGQTWATVGGAISGGGGALIGFNIAALLMEDNSLYSAPLLYTGCGMVILGTIFSSVGTSKTKTAVELYNASVRRQQISDISLKFGITRSGGVGLTFNF